MNDQTARSVTARAAVNLFVREFVLNTKIFQLRQRTLITMLL